MEKHRSLIWFFVLGTAVLMISTTTGQRPARCKLIACGWPKCPGGVRPSTKPGKCCPSCPSQRPARCKLIACGWPKCPGGVRPITKPGNCCPSCPAVARTPCTDNNAKCSGWAVKGECARNPRWMLVNCRRSCKQC